MEMGFSRELAQAALKRNSSVPAAMEWLFSATEEQKERAVQQMQNEAPAPQVMASALMAPVTAAAAPAGYGGYVQAQAVYPPQQPIPPVPQAQDQRSQIQVRLQEIQTELGHARRHQNNAVIIELTKERDSLNREKAIPQALYAPALLRRPGSARAAQLSSAKQPTDRNQWPGHMEKNIHKDMRVATSLVAGG